MKRFFITGTDTGVGKTLAAAILTRVLNGCYWKPIQSGIAEEEADSSTVRCLVDLPTTDIFPSTYALKAPLSPHHAAEQEKIVLQLSQCAIPSVSRPLIIEGAGGVYVPLNKKHCMLDLMAYCQCPIIIVSRGTLGTINHTLLTIQALRQRNLPIHGVIFSGELNPRNQHTIEQWGQVRTLFHIPQFDPLTPVNVQSWVQQQQDTILVQVRT